MWLSGTIYHTQECLKFAKYVADGFNLESGLVFRVTTIAPSCRISAGFN